VSEAFLDRVEDIRARAMARANEARRLELGERLAHGQAGDAELLGQLAVRGGQARAGRKDALDHQALELGRHAVRQARRPLQAQQLGVRSSGMILLAPK
jgi:hypothetical protein